MLPHTSQTLNQDNFCFHAIAQTYVCTICLLLPLCANTVPISESFLPGGSTDLSLSCSTALTTGTSKDVRSRYWSLSEGKKNERKGEACSEFDGPLGTRDGGMRGKEVLYTVETCLDFSQPFPFELKNKKKNLKGNTKFSLMFPASTIIIFSLYIYLSVLHDTHWNEREGEFAFSLV